MYQSHMGRIFPIQGARLEGGEMIHEAAKPAGERNTYEVYSEEGRIATVLNGVPAEFRNIRIRRHSPSHHLWEKGEPLRR